MEVGVVHLINGRSLKVESVCVVNRSVPSSVGGFSHVSHGVLTDSWETGGQRQADRQAVRDTETDGSSQHVTKKK